MDILDLLLRPGTYVLGLAVYVATWLTRRGVQTAWPSLKKQADANDPAITYLTPMSRWWNEVILYAVPVAYGALASCIPSQFLFDGFDGGAKFMYGAGVGWCSSFLYKALKKAVLARAGMQPQDLVSEVSKA
jgi:hypothetical protein